MRGEIEWIKQKWELEKEAGPILYVIDEEEIDFLFTHIHSLEEKVRELQEKERE